MVRVMNLDGMFLPIPTTEIKFEKFKFPGGEVHLKLNNRTDYSKIEKVIITHRVNNSDNLMEILMAKDALERKGIKVFELVMPYVPYARQDRICNEGEPFSLKVFVNIINSMNFQKVYVLDSHSDVAPALINNCVNVGCESYVDEALHDINNPNLIYIIPDVGASKKAYGIFSKVGKDRVVHKNFGNEKVIKGIPFYYMVQCNKKRDLATGKLTGFKVYPDSFEGYSNDAGGMDCMIVDDICDGGGTFIGLVEELKKYNVGNIYLFVTHGIFSKGFDELKPHFKMIYTTNSVKDINESFVKQLKINL